MDIEHKELGDLTLWIQATKRPRDLILWPKADEKLREFT